VGGGASGEAVEGWWLEGWKNWVRRGAEVAALFLLGLAIGCERE